MRLKLSTDWTELLLNSVVGATNEKGCAVIEAVENGQIEESRYHNFLKLQREKVHFESSLQEKHAKDKEFGKMVKNIKKGLHKRKY